MVFSFWSLVFGALVFCQGPPDIDLFDTFAPRHQILEGAQEEGFRV